MSKDDRHKYSTLIDSFLGKDHSLKVRTRFYAWLLGKKGQEAKERVMLEKFESYDIAPDQNVLKSLSKVHEKIGFAEAQPQVLKTKKIPMHRKMLRIAAIIVPIAILAGTGFYLSGDTETGHFTPEYLDIVALAEEKQNVTLPDNSTIWVNSSSKVKYLKNNQQAQRLIELEGEAYFEIEKDTANPFVVQTAHLSVTVVGTKFDVKEIEDLNMTIVTLTEGKVNIKTKNHDIFSLRPSQQLKYYHLTGKTEVVNLDVPSVENTIIWKNERLQFKEVSLQEMIAGVETYFNVVADCSALSMIDNRSFTIRFSPNESLSSTMRILRELTGSFDYEIGEQKIYIKDKQVKNINKEFTN